LQTVAHYREDEEIRRKVKWQKPHLKKNRVSSRFSRVARVVAPAGLLTNPNRSSHRVDRVPGRLAGLGRV
jgi:hypothetical protein